MNYYNRKMGLLILTEKQSKLVSIITPAYNAEKFIAETIESVLKQTYSNWEMIIVDDRSRDRTIEIIKEYQKKDRRIKLIKLEKNSGSAIARNTAMDQSKGKYLAFLDSDDLWLPEKLEKQVAFMENKNIAFSFTRYVRVREDGTETTMISKVPEIVTYEDLMKQCVIGCLTVMLDREKIGNMRMVNIRTRQDYAFWLKILRNGYLAYGYPEILAHYRLVENSISSNKVQAAKRNWYVYRSIEKHNLPRALWYFANYGFRSVTDLIRYKVKEIKQKK